jgi:enediyne biosynthesis protein E4
MGKARILVTILFILLLSSPLVYKRVVMHRQAAAVANQTAAALAAYGFHLTECARTSGVDFHHQAPKLDPKLNHIMEQIASMGAAVSVVDFDRDGWPDFYVTSSGEHARNALYRGQASPEPSSGSRKASRTASASGQPTRRGSC